MGTMVMLKNVRVSIYNNQLTSPQKFDESDDKSAPKYSLKAILVPSSENVKALEAAISKEALGEWADKAKGVLDSLKATGKFGYMKRARTNSEGEVLDGFENSYSVGANRPESFGPPTYFDNIRDLADGVKWKALSRDEAAARIYSGCFANVLVEVGASSKKNKVMRFTLAAVQFVKDGDAFSRTTVSPQLFDDLNVIDEAAPDTGGSLI